MAVSITTTPQIVDFVLNKPAFKVHGSASPVKLVAGIFIEEVYLSGVYTQLPDIYLDPDSNDDAVFHIDHILRDYYETIKTDIYSLAAMAQDNYSLKRYYVNFYEWNGSVLGPVLGSNVLYLLYGRLSYQDWPGHTFFADLTTNLNYLNNIGSKINTWITAKNYLYFLNYIPGTINIELRATIYYTDKTNEDQTLDTYASLNKYDVLVVPAGAAELNLASFTPTKTIYRYDLGLYKTDDTQIGKTISYYLHNKPWWSQQFLFRNDYGVLESVIAQGKELTGIKYKIETSKKRIQYNYDPLDFQYTQRIASRTKPFVTNLGPFSRSEAEHLEELVNDKLFKVGDSKLIPCNILSSELKTVDQSKDLQVIELKYQYAFDV